MLFVSVTVALILWVASPINAWLLPSQQSPQQSQASQPTSIGQNSSVAGQPKAAKPCAFNDGNSRKQTGCASSPRKVHKKHQPSTAAADSTTASTKVVPNGGTTDPIVAISPTQSQQQASQELNTTNELLTNADVNLKELGRRQLSTDEEEIVKQIQVYMQQARTAVKNGEAQRAYILANKADMLSTDLVRQRR